MKLKELLPYIDDVYSVVYCGMEIDAEECLDDDVAKVHCVLNDESGMHEIEIELGWHRLGLSSERLEETNEL